MTMTHFVRVPMMAAVVAALPIGALAQNAAEALHTERLATAETFAQTLEAAECPAPSGPMLTLEAGKSYFGCDFSATLVTLEGDGDTSLANTSISATMFRQKSTGTVDMTVARMSVTSANFSGAAVVNLQGARVHATSFCGDLSSADLSGANIAATSISATLDKAILAQATFHTNGLNAGSARGAEWNETVVTCNISHFDFTGSIGRPTGQCNQRAPVQSAVTCY